MQQKHQQKACQKLSQPSITRSAAEIGHSRLAREGVYCGVKGRTGTETMMSFHVHLFQVVFIVVLVAVAVAAALHI